MLVLAHVANRPFPADNLHRHNLLRQNAVALGLRRALLAAPGESVLIGSADI